jgi:hypothetical protein
MSRISDQSCLKLIFDKRGKRNFLSTHRILLSVLLCLMQRYEIHVEWFLSLAFPASCTVEPASNSDIQGYCNLLFRTCLRLLIQQVHWHAFQLTLPSFLRAWVKLSQTKSSRILGAFVKVEVPISFVVFQCGLLSTSVNSAVLCWLLWNLMLEGLFWLSEKSKFD